MIFFVDTADADGIRRADGMGLICGAAACLPLMAGQGRALKEGSER